MEALLKVIALAVLQGITEFLPVSSSGHLVLGESLLGVESPGATLEVVLHAGTLAAILVFYRRRLLALALGAVRRDPVVWRDIGTLALSAVPAVVLYLAAGDVLETAFDRVEFVGPALCVTGLMLLSVRGRPVRGQGEVRWTDAFLIGVAQAVAMLPGISRSGSTISAARLRGVAPTAAAEFSFLMCIPLLAGATLLTAVDAFQGAQPVGIPAPHLIVGAVVAGVVGYAALAGLVRLLGRGKFWIFGVYCLVVGGVATLVHWA
jgi:undecaprenyl-diphosphatase